MKKNTNSYIVSLMEDGTKMNLENLETRVEVSSSRWVFLGRKGKVDEVEVMNVPRSCQPGCKCTFFKKSIYWVTMSVSVMFLSVNW